MKQGALWVGMSRSAAAVVVATCTAVLAGCTPQPPPPPTGSTPAASPDAEPEATPTPETVTPPERPADMNRTDEAGAVAAATYFMELYSYVMRSGDVAEWDAISGQTCTFCENTRTDSLAVRTDGGRLTGGDLTIHSAEVATADPAIGAFDVAVRYSFSAGQEITSAGSVVRELEAVTGTALLDVASSQRGWTLIEGRGGSDDAA